MRRIWSGFMLICLAALLLIPTIGSAAPQQNVYVLRIDNFQSIDAGIAQITKRAFADAAADPNAVAVVVTIDTPGGLVTAALEIKDTLLGSRLRTITLVEDSAWSAGALIATAGEKLYMYPGSSIGAAEPRVQGSTESADYKALSAVVGAFRSTAEARGRDPQIAQAMVDKSAKIPGQTTELLVLTAKEAVEKQYADGEARSVDEALQLAGITDYQLVEVQPTLSEQVGRILTTPWVAILLLVAGIVAIGIEFMQPGLTVPGLIGVICLGLFFLGNVLVGTAGWLELSLAIIGVLLLVIEAFVPGFGIFGIGGVIAVTVAMFMAVPEPDMAMRYLMWSSLAFMFALFGAIRGISQRGLGKYLTLSDDEKNWVPARNDHSVLIGTEGVSLSVLRPGGTAKFGQERVDVVTRGEYLEPGTRITAVKVEGTRVVVRSIEED
jgi:membrane-bound serine protease (ClpP class)